VKTAAIYARVSSERQKEEQTIASQTAVLKEYAEAKGYTVPVEWIFQDEGYSGSLLVRPGLERLRDLAAEGQIETLLVYSPDRLSRKYAYQVLLTEELARNGVQVIFLRSPQGESPEDQLLLQFQGMIAEYERAQILERTRRGKRHRAKSGLINVLSGAPYGYRYLKKSDTSAAVYEVMETEAVVVRQVYRRYTEEGLSIGQIARELNGAGIATRSVKSRWERSTVWGMLRNPAYKGTACFGKTERAERKKTTRPLRQRGGFTPRCSSTRERPTQEWIEIPVPALVSEETFALAQERLERNKRFSLRHTKEPTLLQGLLICNRCGYAYYRTSTQTSSRKLYYYRCLGSDAYRHFRGSVCHNPPIRQDYLDQLVWKQVMGLLENPELVRTEIDRRLREIHESHPSKLRKETLLNERTRVQKGIDRLLDAYQEGLLPLLELRRRIPELRKRESTLQWELQNLEASSVEQGRYLQLAESLEGFLDRMRKSAEDLNVIERQKVLRQVVKEILVGPDTLTIKHSIPVGGSSSPSPVPSYLLCGRRLESAAVEPLPGPSGSSDGRGRSRDGALCGRFRAAVPEPGGS
jgi:site-specific DNA recombinase